MIRWLSQGYRFVFIGLVLIGFDSLCCALLVVSGMPLAIANPLSRGLAAALGFALHLHYTFAETSEGGSDVRQGPQGRLLRYALVWLLLTFVSTRVLLMLQAGADTRLALWAKAPVEAVLALCSFLLLKLWVYRR